MRNFEKINPVGSALAEFDYEQDRLLYVSGQLAQGTDPATLAAFARIDADHAERVAKAELTIFAALGWVACGIESEVAA